MILPEKEKQTARLCAIFKKTIPRKNPGDLIISKLDQDAMFYLVVSHRTFPVIKFKILDFKIMLH